MKALLYGVKPEPVPEPDTDNRLLRSLERLRDLTMDQINERYEAFKLMSQFEVGE